MERSTINWGATAIRGSVRDHPSFRRLSHATDVETALVVVRKRSIQTYPERERGRALRDKPIEVVWLSPNTWEGTNGNEYGCIAFDFDWTALIEEYGKYIYGLEVLERTALPTSRILFSDKRLDHYFGRCYNPKLDGVPWRTHKRDHYIKKRCVLQVAVSQALFLDDLHAIEFVDQRAGRTGRRIHRDDAARLFLSRAVSEQLPPINGFSGLDPTEGRPYEQLLFAWEMLWNRLWTECKNGVYGDFHGTIRSNEAVAETLARSFLDRYGRLYPPRKLQLPPLLNDAKNIGSLFHSPKDLLLSIRKAVARWARIDDRKKLNGEDWPPWRQ